jgi:hypothetical protein
VVRTTGTGGEAEIRLCDMTTSFFPVGVVEPNHCGSLTARVVAGPLDVLLGSLGVATIPGGVTFRIAEVAPGQFEILYLDGVRPIRVEFQGEVTDIGPGGAGTFPDPAGHMRGAGHLDAHGRRHHFEFDVRERADGRERGRLEYRIQGRRFVSTAVNVVTFSDGPRVKPARAPEPSIDTVLFAGTGRWNGTPGYTFQVRGVDAGEPGRGRDHVTITITDPMGRIVVSVSGTLTGGNIQSHRVRR